MGYWRTVFQSESIAIMEGHKLARHLTSGDRLTILTDNQALVYALADYRETSITIADIIFALWNDGPKDPTADRQRSFSPQWT